jgi:hypothetical protein
VKKKRGKIDTSKMTKSAVEKLSKRSAQKLILGTDKLKSRGKTGWYKSKRLNKYFKFKSSIEMNVIKTLDEAEDYIVDFDTEQFMIPYTYHDGPSAITYNYVPDFVLKTVNGKTFVIEVKPVSQFEEAKNVAKWTEAKTWCWRQGAKFLVISEKDWPNTIAILKHLELGKINEAQQLMHWSLV